MSRAAAAGLLVLGLIACREAGPPAVEPEPAADPSSDPAAGGEAVPAWADPTLPVATAPATRPWLPAERAFDLAPRGVARLRLLDHLDEARIVVPQDVRPLDSSRDGHFLLGSWTRTETQGLYEHPSPVVLAQKRFREAPPGIALVQDGAPLPFAPGVSEDGPPRTGWEQVGDTLYLSAAAPPRPGLVLVHPATAQAEEALNHGVVGGDLASFVRREVTLGGETRQALHLPAPAALSLRVAAPAGARLRLEAGVQAGPVVGAEGAAALLVYVDGEERLREELRSGEGWRHLELDLGLEEPGTVELTFRSSARGTGERGYLAVGVPELLGPATESLEGPARVVLLGLDTLRPDHLGANGYPRETSPNLDALAARSTVFARAWAPAPRTRPSFRTLLTGRWPLQAPAAPNLAEQLAPLGFATAGIVANVHLAPRMDFHRGFDAWSYHNSDPAEVQVARALSWLRSHAHEDAFLFLHLMDPHIHYRAPAPFLGRWSEAHDQGALSELHTRWTVASLEAQGDLGPQQQAWLAARYDEEILGMDAALGALLEGLEELPGETLLVVASDHGEELWEHGAFEHNHALWEELSRAVLWLRAPGQEAGQRLDTPASLADVVPTVRELVGLPPLEAAPGRSLAAALTDTRGTRWPAEAAAIEARPLLLGHLMFAPEQWGVVMAGHKYLWETASGWEALYDLEADPRERHDLAATAEAAATVEAAREALAQALGATEAGGGWRIWLDDLRQTRTVHFEAPVRAAWVVPPDVAAAVRANPLWGQHPELDPEDVATVELGDGGRSLVLRPGRSGSGVVAVLGAGPEARAVVLGGEAPVPLSAELEADTGAGRLTARPGFVLRPGTDELAALREAGLLPSEAAGQDPAEAELTEALQALGYLHP